MDPRDEAIEENIRELQRRGYAHRISTVSRPGGVVATEDEWVKGDHLVSIHTVRKSHPSYFKGLLDANEGHASKDVEDVKTPFKFEVICPPVKTISEDWKEVKLEVIC